MIQTGHARARAVAKRYDPTAHTRLALFPQVQRSPGCDSLAQAMGARVAGDEQAQHSLFLVFCAFHSLRYYFMQFLQLIATI